MSQIVNESTAVVQIDSSRLQNGNYVTVYVSTTIIPGQLVTVLDATGYLSSPQAVLLSTVGTTFSDGSYSTVINQRFSYVTLVSRVDGTWSYANDSHFPNPTISSIYRGFDAIGLLTSSLSVTSLISSANTFLSTVEAQSFTARGYMLINRLYVNSLSSFISSSPIDYRFTVNGLEHIYGSTTTIGAGSFRGSISTGGDFFNTGNISSKLGTIYVGGDVTTMSSIRGQRGLTINVASLSTFTTAGFVGPVTITSSVTSANYVKANNIQTRLTTGLSMNVMSSVIFSPTQAIRYRTGYLEFLNTPVTIPSSISSLHLSASNSLATSNLTLESFGPASTLAIFRLGSTQIADLSGALIVSSISGNYLTLSSIATARAEVRNTLSVSYLTMNDVSTLSTTTISYLGTSTQIPVGWMISSINTGGTMNAPYGMFSTTAFFSKYVQAGHMSTVNDNFINFLDKDTTVTSSINFSSIQYFSIKGVFINNHGGAILGNRAETIHSVNASSIKTNIISAPTVVFAGSNNFYLPVSYISSLNSGNITTSSLVTSKIFTGSDVIYSTINPSTPWTLASTFNMRNTFTATKGLGTYFDQVTFIATTNQTAYYTLVDPRAQKQSHLSTLYVNSVTGTGLPGTISTPTQAASNTQIGYIAGQPASDSAFNLYVGSGNAGWRVQRISPQGMITTLAGNNQFFYGDGQFPPSAAFGPRLAVSINAPGTLLITDISNSRIRYVTTDPIVTTIAGTGVPAYYGDGGLAFNANLSTPTTTATDSAGRIFIADTANQLIRVIANSTITAYGGTGQIGNTGDGGPATVAKLNSPFGLAVDSANNLLFTDLSNCAIRSISPAGTIQRLAGTYANGFGGDGGLALNSVVAFPRGIAVDAVNNIYFCDTGNSRVRRIDAATKIITTIAGNGVEAFGGDGGLGPLANLSTPTGVATDAAGNVYISDTNNHCIRYVNMATSTITTVAGRPGVPGYGGDRSFATFAFLNSPSHIAYDGSSGYYYIADDGNRRIRYVNSGTKIIFTAAGNGSPFTSGDGGAAVNAVFGSINSVVTDSKNNIYVVDGLGNAIRRIDAVTSTITTVVGTGIGGYNGDGLLGTAAQISTPQTLVIDSNTNLFFTDTNNQRIRRVDSTTKTIATIAGTGVAGYNGDSIASITANLNSPKALARDSAGALYVGDTSNYRIRRISPAGIITTYAGRGIYGPPTEGANFLTTNLGITTALTVDLSGQLYMADYTTSAIWAFSNATNTLAALSAISTPAYLGDAGPLSNAYFNQPTGLIVDICGNFLISDAGNYRLRRTNAFGNPQNSFFVNMNFKYTNYFTSTGTSYISLNGNLLTSFNGSSQSTLTYSLTDADILNYPLQSSNPVYGNQAPFIQITSVSTFGYTKLEGNMWLNEVPGQGFLQDSVDSNSGLIMNSGTLVFPYQINGTTIDNPYNDASLRTINYTGSLNNASDPALKESIESANLSICYTTLASLNLHRYKYIDPYMSSFHLRDKFRLGFLTSEVALLLPNSITSTNLEQVWAPSSINTLDMSQIKYTHFGVTQNLIGLVNKLEEEVSTLVVARDSVRELVAQRNNVL